MALAHCFAQEPAHFACRPLPMCNMTGQGKFLELYAEHGSRAETLRRKGRGLGTYVDSEREGALEGSWVGTAHVFGSYCELHGGSSCGLL